MKLFTAKWVHNKHYLKRKRVTPSHTQQNWFLTTTPASSFSLVSLMYYSQSVCLICLYGRHGEIWKQKTAQERPKEEDQGTAALPSFSISLSFSKAQKILTYFQRHNLIEWKSAYVPKGCLSPQVYIQLSPAFLFHFQR